MRIRILAVAAVAALVCFGASQSGGHIALPNLSAMIRNLSNPPFRFTLRTLPEPPTCGSSITLKVHAIDADSKPANGLKVEARVSSADGVENGAQQITLHGKGGRRL
jgi:hypothetical protein